MLSQRQVRIIHCGAIFFISITAFNLRAQMDNEPVTAVLLGLNYAD
jgi:hypothetical protein